MSRLDAPCVAHIHAEKVRWLWPGRIPQAKLTTLDGDPGLGKSSIVLDIAARVSTASPLPDGTSSEWPRDIVLLSAEDGIGDTIRPRLEAAGADLNRVHVMRGVRDAEGEDIRPPVLPHDLALLRSLILETEAALVVVDPIMAYLDGKVDSHRDQDVRRALHLLTAMAEETDASVLIVRHLTKGTAGGNPLYRGGGSIGIIGAARSGMVVAADPEDDTRRILAMTKSNLAVLAPALAYRLVPDELRDVAQVKWEGRTSHTASQILSTGDDDHSGAMGDAIEFLKDLLADGAVAAKEALRQARDAGVAERTLRRAQKALKVQSSKVGGPESGDQKWVWSLPEDCQAEAKAAKAANESSWTSSEVASKKAWQTWHSSGEVGNLHDDDQTLDIPEVAAAFGAKP